MASPRWVASGVCGTSFRTAKQGTLMAGFFILTITAPPTDYELPRSKME
jgi:hypothetical protein